MIDGNKEQDDWVIEKMPYLVAAFGGLLTVGALVLGAIT